MQLTLQKIHLTQIMLKKCEHLGTLNVRVKRMNSIKIKNLSKCYGDFFAVDNLSFLVDEGEFVGFLGVNGAGKSTTINIMSTLLAPTSGSVEICGYELSKANEIRKRIGVVYQENVLDDLLTAKENLMNRGILYGISKRDTEKR